ncbi:M48 family metalloprotease [Sphingomicrobium flavum]|uniref:M48 family metalloprotease n=1 Tax=Sphingomicrobium flavum TaxID=1229164 RepID=UPI0021ADF96A|nr:M48 family metalloprotease [Sphingomicrobium flavum]
MKFSGILATGGNALPRSVMLEAREDGLYLTSGFGEPERLKWRSLLLDEAGEGRFQLRRRFKRGWSIGLSADDARQLGAFLDGAPPPLAPPAPEPVRDFQPVTPPPPEPEPVAQEELEELDEQDDLVDAVPGLSDLAAEPPRYRSGTAAERWTGMDIDDLAHPPPEPTARYRTTASEQWGEEEEVDRASDPTVDWGAYFGLTNEELQQRIRMGFIGFIILILLTRCLSGDDDARPQSRDVESAPIVTLPVQPPPIVRIPNDAALAAATGQRCDNQDAYAAIRRILLRLWPGRAYDIPIDIVDLDEAWVTALPGGKIALTSGAIHEFDDGELAALLAHQIAHLQNRDIDQGDPPFSLRDEAEADERARRILIAVRMPLADGAAMYRRFVDEGASGDPWLARQMELHPLVVGQADRWDSEAALQQDVIDAPLLTASQREDLADACPDEAISTLPPPAR